VKLIPPPKIRPLKETTSVHSDILFCHVHEFVPILLEHGTDSGAHNNPGATPLHFAVSCHSCVAAERKRESECFRIARGESRG
jgi:hypothetical protein